MSNEVINPYQTFFDDSGVPLANGTITFNVNSTTTLDTIYSDEALTTVQANPYTLDAYGRITGDVKYRGLKRLVIKTAAGATVRTLDNVSTTQGTVAGSNPTGSVTTIAALKALTGQANNDTVIVLCHTKIGDGGGGIFLWGADDATTDDNGVYIQPDAGGTGRWKRLRDNSRRYSCRWYGLTGDGSTDDTAISNSTIVTINGYGGGVLHFPLGTYMLDAVTPLSNVWLDGDGILTVFKVRTAGTNNILNNTGSSLTNFKITNIKFDGSLNYPADSTTYKTNYTNGNTAIRLAPTTLSDVTIEHCYFNELSNQSIDINVDAAENVKIRFNDFYKGSYKSCVILCRIPSAASSTTRLREFDISHNNIDTCGPQQYYDASYEDYLASSDGIQIDKGMNCTIAYNFVKKAASIGIRVEQSEYVNTIGNIVIESGNEGIVYYKQCFGGSCTGNTVRSWGRTPPAYAMRNYGGTYYIAREFPISGTNPLPADPSASAYWEVWPFITSGINTSTIKTYSATEYYIATPSDGVLPFRGTAAIGCFQDSEGISVSGNTCIGDTTQSGGKYNYASDFGYSIAHPTNSPAAVTAEYTGRLNQISGNVFSDVRVQKIYRPKYQDPLAIAGQLGVGEYNGVIEGTYTAVMTADSGTITLGNNELSYKKMDRLCHVTGQLSVSSVSTPTGDCYISLPFASNNSDIDRMSFTSFFIRADTLTGSPTGIVLGYYTSAASVLTLQLVDDFSYSSLSTSLQSGSTLTVNFCYQTAS